MNGTEALTPAGSEATVSQKELWRQSARSRRGELAHCLDRALAFRLDPSQPLVISGFSRSGKTWLEEALREIPHAKTLFEPCDPLAREMQALHAEGGVDEKSFEFLRLYMPYCRSETLDDTPLRELFRKARLGWRSLARPTQPVSHAPVGWSERDLHFG